jgi:hypothetical protein
MDGAGRAWQPSRGRIGVTLALALASIGLLIILWMPTWSEVAPAEAVAVAPRPAPAPAAIAAPAAAHQAQARAPEGDADPTPDLSSYVARGDNPSMAEVIERLHQRGIYSGLGAFSPPGTSPPLVGLAVPEDFVLPKGYVRHHQTTDDGQRIEAILMFAPDFQLLDAHHHPIAMPANRVVPPELVPPGFPLRRIVIPPPTDPATSGR